MAASHDRIDLQQVFPELPADIDIAAFDAEAVPVHLAVIMDGNGRWAEQRGLSRARGHSAGIKAVRELIQTANDVGIRYLTIYSFSTENWSRSPGEVSALMRLFAQTMLAELDALHEKGVRVRVIGDMLSLPQATRSAFQQAVDKTQANPGMSLVIAVNYGGRQELLRAVRSLVGQAAAGQLDAAEAEALGYERLESELFTYDIPDPDLLIRTSGEYRISNFLLYQLAYSELYFSDVFWPDFDRYELLRALIAYQGRRRRFGRA